MPYPVLFKWVEQTIAFQSSASDVLRDLLKQNATNRGGIFHDVEELIVSIGDYIDRHNGNPKPFIRTAKASGILEQVKRARKALDIR